MSAVAIQTLGWTLVHFLWEGAALAVLLYLSVSFTRDSRVRYELAVCALAIMALAPVATFMLLYQWQDSSALLPLTGNALGQIRTVSSTLNVSVVVPAGASLNAFDWLSCFVWLWSCGVLLFGMRALGGWLVIERLRRATREMIDGSLLEQCRSLERRLGIRKPIRYAQSENVDSPAVVGWFRPCVLLPVATLAGLSAEQLEAVIAHELAHIRRYDALVNIFQIAIETLLFYQPAVWWVNRFVRRERENCCDDVAVEVCGNPGEYARALTLICSPRVLPAWAVAANGGALKSRIARLLGMQSLTRGVPATGLAIVFVLCASCVLLASSAFQQDLDAPPRPLPPAARPSPTRPAPRAARTSPVSPVAAPVAPLPPVPPGALPAAAALASAVPVPALAPVPAIAAFPEMRESAEEHSGESYIDSLQAVGLKNLSVDELIALKVQGVNADYVRSIHAAGLNPTVHELISIKVQGVTGEYVRALQAGGFGDLKIQDFISAKVQGVTPEFVQKVKSHGFKDLSFQQLIRLKMAGIF